MLLQADEPADGCRRTAGPGSANNPAWDLMYLLIHLGEDAFGNIVVAAPVGGALGVGELVHVVPAGLALEAPSLGVDGSGIASLWQTS